MEIMTVSEVSKAFHVSTRMLRYYEKMGLIVSRRKEGYAYRLYDEKSVRRLQQIILLRKLRIPLKQIAIILDDEMQADTLRILQENIEELDEEINALEIIRNILSTFVSRLDKKIQEKIQLDMLEDDELIEITNALVLPKSNLKEEYSMTELNQASVQIEKRMDIRIIYLPPAVVAASHYIGENPEDVAGDKLEAFIRDNHLVELKPDFRVYGFNNPSPEKQDEPYGYEFWVTIPENLEVSGPLIKKEFSGGLYAAHCIKMGDFHEWGLFMEQMKASKEYEIEWREPFGMGGCLEEHINAYSVYQGDEKEFTQLDLLIPIKKKG